MSYVICPETITGPAPAYDWIPPNMPCGAKCEVEKLGPVMHFRCPRGHAFYATPLDVIGQMNDHDDREQSKLNERLNELLKRKRFT